MVLLSLLGFLMYNISMKILQLNVWMGKVEGELKRFLENSSTSQNSRLHQILGMYLLSERWIEDESRFVRQQNIDYEKSETILREKRLISEDFLRKFI